MMQTENAYFTILFETEPRTSSGVFVFCRFQEYFE